MPDKFHEDPDMFWRIVWGKIRPDLVFLGEENHPLEPIYRLQSQHLGGILLIDKKPVTVRSEELLKIR